MLMFISCLTSCNNSVKICSINFDINNITPHATTFAIVYIVNMSLAAIKLSGVFILGYSVVTNEELT